MAAERARQPPLVGGRLSWGRDAVENEEEEEWEEEESADSEAEVRGYWSQRGSKARPLSRRSSGASNLSQLEGLALTSRISQLVEDVQTARRLKKSFVRKLALAISVGFWVTVFGMPLYSLQMYKLFFGQRDKVIDVVRQQFNRTAAESSRTNGSNTFQYLFLAEKFRLLCASADTGRMRNTAPDGEMPSLVAWRPSMAPWDESKNKNDIWCGVFPRTYLASWPQIASFVLFNAYKNTGTTIMNVVKGLAGTALASLNMQIMMRLFSSGARGHECVPQRTSGSGHYTIIWHSRSYGWGIEQAFGLELAVRIYNSADLGGLQARAIFDSEGKLDTNHVWFQPGWKHKIEAEFDSLVEEDCAPGTLVYDDPLYAKYGVCVCMFDVMFVLFLFLISKAPRSVIMAGMVWHVKFMMKFMNPEFGVEHNFSWSVLFSSDCFVVLATSAVGGVFAVVATLLPGLRLCNLANLFDDSMAISYDIIKIWSESIAYLGGDERTAKRFQIETKIDSLTSKVSEVKENFEGAWWETLDLGSCGKTRRLLDSFNTNGVEIRDMLYVVKACVLTETFGGAHSEFWQLMREPAKELKNSAGNLIWLCLEACKDGTIDEDEAADIRDLIAVVRDKQLGLISAFHKASPMVCEDLAEENIFVFALSSWARKTSDFAEHVIDMEQDKPKSIWRIILDWLVSVWSPREIFLHDHLMFCVRNLVSIGICFLIGYFGEGSIFSRYNATMASTLTLLIGKDQSNHLDLAKNTQRLLAVTLGKTLPIMAGVMMFQFACWSWGRFIFQGFLVWAYVSVWMLVYFTSEQWSYAGCLIAGFGVSQLLQPCTVGGEASLFQSRYMEIGNVTVAICVQAIVHLVLSRHSPRQLLVMRMQKLCAAVTRGYEAAFAADLDAMQAAIREASKELAVAKELAPECDPAARVFQGTEAPFKLELCYSAFQQLALLIGELNMLIVAAKDWLPYDAALGADGPREEEAAATPAVLELVRTRPAWKNVEAKLLSSLHLVAESLPDMLADHPEEGDCKVRLRDLKGVAIELKGVEALYRQLDRASQQMACSDEGELTSDLRARLTVVVRALENAERHLCRIEERCIKEIII